MRLNATLSLAAAIATLAGLSSAHAQGQRQFSLTLYDQPDYRGASVTFYGDNAAIGSTGFATRAQSAQVRGTWRLCEGGGYRNRCEVLNANVRDLSAYGLSGRVGSAQLLAGGVAAAPPPGGLAAPPPADRYADDRRYEQRYAPPAEGPGGPGAYGRGGYAQEQYPPPPYAQPYPSYPAGPDRGDDRPPAGYPPAPGYPPAADRAAPYGDVPYGPAPYVPRGYGDGAAAEGRTAVFFARPRMRGLDVAAARPQAADAFCRTQGLGSAIYFDQRERAPRAVDVDGRDLGPGPVLRDVLCRR